MVKHLNSLFFTNQECRFLIKIKPLFMNVTKFLWIFKEKCRHSKTRLLPCNSSMMWQKMMKVRILPMQKIEPNLPTKVSKVKVSAQ